MISGESVLWVELVCHECAASGLGQFVRGGRIPVRAITNEALRIGWRRLTGGEFECPRCHRETIKRCNELAGPYKEPQS